MKTLPVNEVFETVQGEARFTGTPAIFVRLQGCEVGCPWCDTKHTWLLDPDQKRASDEVMAKTDDSPTWADMLPTFLANYLEDSFQARHVVITGGEPSVYDLRPFTAALIMRGYSVQLETSATQPIRVDPNVWVTVSPKIDMPGGFKVRRDSMLRADEIKHPVGKMADVEKLESILPMKREGAEVWLQPLSESRKATALCVQVATERGWRVSIQTHKAAGLR